MNSYDRVARAVFETPWFIREREGRIMAELVLERIRGNRVTDDEIAARLETARAAQGPRRGPRHPGDVGVIGIYGVIMPRANLMTEMSGGTSIESIRAAFNDALGDDAIKSILFDVDSPGGAVDGVEELASEIRAARGRKPMVAISNTTMCSAAYYLGCQADEIVATPSSVVGSIGVFVEHVEYSKADEALGATVTIIRQPVAKHDVNDSEPLTPDALDWLHQLVGDYYGQFTNAVAEARGVTPAAVRSGYGQGRYFVAARAKEAGLVDRIDTFQATYDRLAAGKGPFPRGMTGLAELAGLPVADRVAAYAQGIAAGDFTPGQVRAQELGGPIEFNASGEIVGVHAGPLKRHTTETTDEPWDGPMMEARCPADEEHLTASHAWRDDAGDPDLKGSYKFNHHMIGMDGMVGPASTIACSTGIGYLNHEPGSAGRPDIPDADRPGVHDHLGGHLEDAGKDVPPLRGMAGLAALELARARRR